MLFTVPASPENELVAPQGTHGGLLSCFHKLCFCRSRVMTGAHTGRSSKGVTTQKEERRNDKGRARKIEDKELTR